MASVRQNSAGCYDIIYILLLLLFVAPGKSWVQSGADRRGNGSEPCTCETLSFSQLDVADWMSTFYVNRVQNIQFLKLCMRREHSQADV